MISIDSISSASCNRVFTGCWNYEGTLQLQCGSIILEKGDRYWSCEVNSSVLTYRWGQHGGEEQEQISTVDEGKNIGRSNETTPDEQAIIEAIPKINKKIMEGYEISDVSGVFDGMDFKVKPEVPAPMLALKFEDFSEKIDPDSDAIFQPKLDGIRCIANLRTGELYSRKLEPIHIPRISDAVKFIGETLKSSDWLDGELYSHRMGFQTITSIVRTRNSVHPRIDDIQYHVYDVINSYKCSERMKIVGSIHTPIDINEQPIVVPVKTIFDKTSKSMIYHQKFTRDGYEGVMYRDPESFYSIGKRSKHLLKIKAFIQEEFKVIGLNKEKYENTLGTFACITPDGEVFDARPAFTDSERLEIWKNQDTYDWSKWVATVKFFEYTEDGSPRFPVCLGIRYEADR